jgi:hypothetical protein
VLFADVLWPSSIILLSRARDAPASGDDTKKSTVSDRTLRLFGLELENDTPMFRNVSVRYVGLTGLLGFGAARTALQLVFSDCCAFAARMLSLPHYEQEKMLHLDRLRKRQDQLFG